MCVGAAEHCGVGANPHQGASATMRLVNRRGLGKAKHVDMQKRWIQEASKSTRFVTKRHEREPRGLDDEAAETEKRAAHEHHGLRVSGTVFEASRGAWYEIGGKFDEREGEAQQARNSLHRGHRRSATTCENQVIVQRMKMV